jgi:alanyl-tRNA synthetase
MAPTIFTGYTALSGQGRVLALLVEGQPVAEATAGQRVQVALDRTPFYAEGGGQVGDTGVLAGPHGELVTIMETRRPVPAVIVHEGLVERGAIRRHELVEARVDAERRRAIAGHHTATHLLHRALRVVLGEHAAQVGSLVAPDRLRFDITHPSPLTPEQLASVEGLMNAWVRADTPITWEVTSYGDALDRGAIALFGEKYGDHVRLVTIGCLQAGQESGSSSGVCSRELCGGTHVTRTGEVGYCRLTAESGVAAGVRRIEARVGAAAEAWVAAQTDLLEKLVARLGVPPRDLAERLDRLLVQIKQLQAERDAWRVQAMDSRLDHLLAGAGCADGVTYVAAQVDVPDAVVLREIGDRLREQLSSGVVVLGAVLAGKPRIVVMVTPDVVARGHDARALAKALAQEIGGGGGGQAHLAQAGGEEAARLDQALAAVPALLAAHRPT